MKPFRSPTILPHILSKHLVVDDLRARSVRGAFEEMVDHLGQELGEIPRAELIRRLIEREATASTAIGGGIAFPHGMVDLCRELIVAIGRSSRGIDFGASDGEPVTVVVLIVSCPHKRELCLRALSVLRRVMTPATMERVRGATTPEAIMSILIQGEEALYLKEAARGEQTYASR